MRLIDADELIKKLEGKEEEEYYGWVFNYGDVFDTIDELATVEPGYWIYLDNDELRYDSYRCSNCNRSITVDAKRKDDIGFIIEDMEYCPYCGARMIEVKS